MMHAVSRPMRRAAWLIAFITLAALPALAQEGESSPADSPAGWVFRWLNFAIVFGAIAYFAVKKGGPYFRAHADEISRKIAEGARAREAAEQQRKEIQAKLAGIDQEVAAMKAEAQRDADAETLRLRALAPKKPRKSKRRHRPKSRQPNAPYGSS